MHLRAERPHGLDAYFVAITGDALAETVARAVRYVGAGATCVFVPGVVETGPIRALAAAITGPLNVVVGLANLIDAPTLFSLGVRRVSLGGSLARAALRIVECRPGVAPLRNDARPRQGHAECRPAPTLRLLIASSRLRPRPRAPHRPLVSTPGYWSGQLAVPLTDAVFMKSVAALHAADECFSPRAPEDCVLLSKLDQGRPDMAARYEYRVIQLREGLLGGKMSSDKLQKVLNDNAKDGWQLKAITAVEVKGRVGPGGVEGVLVTFERPLQ